MEVVRPHLEKINFTCETGKSKEKKISVPVLFGYDNKIDKAFNADAVSADGKIVIEIEAGRATENNQFLKDEIKVDPNDSFNFDAWYDNTKDNLDNPDPSVYVTGGLSSEREMGVGIVWLKASSVAVENFLISSIYK